MATVSPRSPLSIPQVGIATFDPQKALVLAECGESVEWSLVLRGQSKDWVSFTLADVHRCSICKLVRPRPQMRVVKLHHIVSLSLSFPLSLSLSLYRRL